MESVKLPAKKENFSDLLVHFFNTYHELGLPIEVSFRKLIPHLNNSDRATHLIHTYPAKLLPHIPYFFLNNTILTKPGDIVLDPFCGSGTVLLESVMSGRNALGADSNPLAILISKVKTTPYNVEFLSEQLIRIINESISVDSFNLPEVVNIDHWFLKRIQKELGRLYSVINGIEDQIIREFFMVCLSNCVKKVSLADPRVSVPVRLRYEQYPDGHPLKKKTVDRLQGLHDLDVLSKFRTICKENIRRFKQAHFDNSIRAEVISSDARLLTSAIDCEALLDNESVDMVLTSPPYGGAQKYIRASSLNLGWLGLLEHSSLSEYEHKSIGREHYHTFEYQMPQKTGILEADILLDEIRAINPLRAHISSNYLIEMRRAIREVHRVLKRDGYFVLVAANNQVCGREFETQFFLKRICLNTGFKLRLELIDDIKSYGLMTKRNKTASIITREWVLIFSK